MIKKLKSSIATIPWAYSKFLSLHFQYYLIIPMSHTIDKNNCVTLYTFLLVYYTKPVQCSMIKKFLFYFPDEVQHDKTTTEK